MSICDHFGNASLTIAGERGFCELRTRYSRDNATNARPRGMRCLRIDWISHDRTLRLTCAQRSELCGRRGSRCACSTRAPQCAKPRSRAHLHQRSAAPSGPLSQAHPVHEARPRRRRVRCSLRRLRRLWWRTPLSPMPSPISGTPTSASCSGRRRRRCRSRTSSTMCSMAVFFLLVGLEIKYEMTVGELSEHPPGDSSHRRCGGRCARARGRLLCAQCGQPRHGGRLGRPDGDRYRVRAGNLGASRQSRAERGARVLSTLAVADDIIAIIVIAVFYGQAPSLPWLGCAAVVFCALLLMNKRHVFSLYAYLLVGAVLWYCVFMSGVHSTIAGVLLAFAIPSGSRVNVKSFIRWTGERVVEAKSAFNAQEPVIGQEDYLKTVSSLARVSKQVVPPATRLEHLLYPWVYFAILPAVRARRTRTLGLRAAIWAPCSRTQRCSVHSSAWWWASRLALWPRASLW